MAIPLTWKHRRVWYVLPRGVRHLLTRAWKFGDWNAATPWTANQCRDAWGGRLMEPPTQASRTDGCTWWSKASGTVEWFRWPWQARRHWMLHHGYPRKAVAG